MEARKKSEAQHKLFRIGEINSLKPLYTAGLDRLYCPWSIPTPRNAWVLRRGLIAAAAPPVAPKSVALPISQVL